MKIFENRFCSVKYLRWIIFLKKYEVLNSSILRWKIFAIKIAVKYIYLRQNNLRQYKKYLQPNFVVKIFSVEFWCESYLRTNLVYISILFWRKKLLQADFEVKQIRTLNLNEKWKINANWFGGGKYLKTDFEMKSICNWILWWIIFGNWFLNEKYSQIDFEVKDICHQTVRWK